MEEGIYEHSFDTINLNLDLILEEIVNQNSKIDTLNSNIETLNSILTNQTHYIMLIFIIISICGGIWIGYTLGKK